MSRTLANASAPDRPATDFYATPPDATLALLKYLNLPRHTRVWEPACGTNVMRNVLIEHFDSVIATDIETGHDFLTITRSADWIITNPPFILAGEFIERAAQLCPQGGFAFLFKSQFWHAAKRLSIFTAHRPAIVLPLTWRPDFLFGAKMGAPTMDVLWTVWAAPYDNTTTLYQPLSRVSAPPDKEASR